MTRTRRTRGRWTVPAAATLCAVGVGALGMAAVRTSLDRAQKELADLDRQIARVTRELEDLSTAVDTLASPSQLEERARELGMRIPLNDQILRTDEEVQP